MTGRNNYGDVLERCTSTGNGLFALSIRMKTRGNTNLVLSWLINGQKCSFPVEVRRSRALLFLSTGNYEGFIVAFMV